MPVPATRPVLVALALVGATLGVTAVVAAPADPAGAVVPGRNSTIAFVSDRDGDDEIYYVAEGTATPVQKTDNGAADRTPRFSPDGLQVVFSTDRDGDDEIYVMDAYGTDPVNVTNSATSSDTDPAWSPDGDQVAFTSDRTGNAEIFTMNADGSGLVNRTNTPGADERGADWSPDGTKIVFSSSRDGGVDIFKMDADGTNRRRLTTDAHADTQPAWSPDGAAIAFASDRAGTAAGRTDVFTMSAGGAHQRRLTTRASAVDEWPAWSPDGRQILFSSDRAGDAEIYRMGADGSALTRLTNAAATDIQPDQMGIPDHRPDLLIRRADQSASGGDDVYNATGAGQSRSAAVAPGGRAVFYVRLTNDGVVPDVFKLRGTPGTPNVTVRYSLLDSGTAGARAGDTWRVITGEIAPSILHPDAGLTVKVVATMAAGAPPSAHAECFVTAISTGDRTRQDTVRVTVTRR